MMLLERLGLRGPPLQPHHNAGAGASGFSGGSGRRHACGNWSASLGSCACRSLERPRLTFEDAAHSEARGLVSYREVLTTLSPL
jgi:hypothetical protein